MILDKALQLSQALVRSKVKHTFYHRANELRETYKALITGDNAPLLKQFIKREDDEAFKQRLAITIAITPAVCSSLQKPFNKVSRNNKVKKKIELQDKQRENVIEQMRQSFYGRKMTKNRGLDYWLKNIYTPLSFVDPNAWVVIEWDAPETLATVIKPRPFIVDSCAAWNWEIVNEELNWLFVHADIFYKKLPKNTRGEADNIAGHQFTLYEQDNTIVFRQVDRKYLTSIGYQLLPNEQYYAIDDKETELYIVSVYNPKLGYVPATRVGYVKDPVTDGGTFVNAWHEALPYLMKTIKTVSEMDLTMCLHAFPQKMQYVQKCPGGGGRKSCLGGKIEDGSICPACKGIGYKVHTSAQDALYFPLPTDAAAGDMLDLEKLLVYKSPDISLLEFQKKYIDSLRDECMAAVFGATSKVKVSNTGQASPTTATEVQMNMQGTYDALYPFTEKVSDIFIDFIYTFALLAGVQIDDSFEVTCIFPADFKMKSVDELLQDLKAVNDAGAPSFLRDQINQDIAEIMYEGDEIAELKYKTRHRFHPYNGATPDEIALNQASQYVSERTKVLYANFEAIFTEIDIEVPDFWLMPYMQQWDIVEAKLDEYIQEITSGNAVPIDFSLNMDSGTPPADNVPADAPADPNSTSGDQNNNNDNQQQQPQ